MEWLQIFESFGVPIAMLIYFIWQSQKRDVDFKVARESHLTAEKEALQKYTELTKQVTEVISTVQLEINALTGKVTELAEIIRKLNK